MTDFFADLEREIRAAHPRRSRPVVPVKGIAATAAVVATLAALVVGVGALTGTTDREIVPRPLPPAVSPGSDQCQVRWLDEPAPAELLDRFEVLRSEGGAGGWDRGVEARVAVVYTDGVREVERAGRRFVVIPVAFSPPDDCDDLTPGVCLYANGGRSQCVRAGRRLVVASVVVAEEPGRRQVFVLGEDAVREIRMQTYGRSGVAWTVDAELRGNIASESLPFGKGQRLRVTPVE